MTDLRCPTCEHRVPKPSWFADTSIFVWTNVVVAGTCMAVLLLAPLPSWVAWCVRDAHANGFNSASCYPPPEPWLALGWLAYAGLWVAAILAVRQGNADYRDEVKNWPRIEERLVPAPMRPFKWRW